MLHYFLLAILWISWVSSFCQSPTVEKSPGDAEVLLAKTKALYDTPFRSGLVNFSCWIDFDFVQHLKSNFGEAARRVSASGARWSDLRNKIKSHGTLTDCEAQHVIVVHAGLPTKP